MKNPAFYRQLKEKKKTDAQKLISLLFDEAENAFKTSPKTADRNVRRARRLAMKHKIRLPTTLKRRFCKNCHRFLMPSVNCRVRLSGGKVVYFCLNCKSYMRLPYTCEKKAKKQKTKKKGL